MIPCPGSSCSSSTRLADRYMTALYTGLGVVVRGCLAVLSLATGCRRDVVAMDAIVLLLLHSRVLVAARHRLAVISRRRPGRRGPAGGGRPAGRCPGLADLVGVAAAAACLFFAERSLPGAKLLPHWGRAGDLLHTLTAAALIPAVLWLVDLYGFARTVHG